MSKLSEAKRKSEQETIVSEVVVGDSGLELSMVGENNWIRASCNV